MMMKIGELIGLGCVYFVSLFFKIKSSITVSIIFFFVSLILFIYIGVMKRDEKALSK